jgi:DNA polymerase I-like protein with 3'-5' exonuclease and polymerase domains
MTLINTVEEFDRAVAYLNEHDEIVGDTETNGLDWAKKDHIVGVSALAGERSFYFPFRHGEGVNLPESCLHRLVEEVFRPSRPQLGFNWSFDTKMLSKEGMAMPRKIQDSILSAHMLNENEDSFKMESLAAKYIDASYAAAEDKLIDLIVTCYGGSRKKAKQHLWRLDPEHVWKYACQDVHTTRDLRDLHLPYLEEWGLSDLMQEVYDWQIHVLEMELRGAQLDVPKLLELQAHAKQREEELQRRIEEAAGYPINLRSSKQVCAWLGVRSSAKDALHEYMDDPNVKLLQEFRMWSKVDDAYYKKYIERMDETGRLTYNLRVGGTTTGRLAASNVNITAVPREAERYTVKDVFIARPGYLLAELDYSQAELRFCGHYSQDEGFCRMLLEGRDLHTEVANALDMPRPRAKNVNFSAWYGIGPKSFSKTYHIPFHESKKYLADYHAFIPGVRRLIKSAERQAERQGYIRMFTGRVRRFNSYRAPPYTASSGLIQGGVAEMLRIALQRIRRELPEVRCLTPIHDAGLFEIPIKGHLELLHEMRRIMQDQPWCSMPMLVDAKFGPRWGKSMTELPRSAAGIPAEVLAKTTDPSIKDR